MRLQLHHGRKQAQRAFTLVEMIGVLAIIAILASLLIPRVFQAIGDSKISNSASTCNSIKAAVNEYYGKYGLIAGTRGQSLTLTNGAFDDWDLKVLVAEGIAEKPFAVRVGNGKIGLQNGGSRLRVVKIDGNNSATDPATLTSGAYNLDGDTNINDIAGMLLVEAIIPEVDAQDAKDLNDRLDGAILGSANISTNDPIGRVKYGTPDSSGKTEVRVYMAHR